MFSELMLKLNSTVLKVMQDCLAGTGACAKLDNLDSVPETQMKGSGRRRELTLTGSLTSTTSRAHAHK